MAGVTQIWNSLWCRPQHLFDTSVAGRYRETCSLGYSQHSRSWRSQSCSNASSHANLRPPPTARLNPSGPAEATANLP